MGIILLEGLLGLLFASWFVGSILNQFSFRWFRHVRKFDCFYLLPVWTFFAPNPGRSDYHLIYRDRRADGSLSEWLQLPLVEARKPYSFIWNPEKRSKKVLFDTVSNCATGIAPEARFDLRPVVLSISYLTILNAVSHHGATSGITHRQFVVAETTGFHRTGTPRIVLRSEFHSIASEMAA